MKTSDSRILITHVGSLPRGERLTDLLIEDELNPATDRTTLTEEIERRVGLVMQSSAKPASILPMTGNREGLASRPTFRNG